MQVTVANFQEVVIKGSLERPVVVNFGAARSGPCKALSAILEKLSGELNFQLAKVDVDAEQQLVAYFRISTVPEVRVFVKGQMVDGCKGAQSESQVRQLLSKHCLSEMDAFLQQVEFLLQQGQPLQALPALNDFLQGEPENRKALYWKARCLVELGNSDEACKVLGLFAEGDDFFAQATALRNLMAFHTEMVRKDLTGPLAESYRQACGAALAGNYRLALESFLHLVEQNRSWNQEAARKAMVTLFGVLGSKHELTWEFRSKLNRIIFV